jgi:galactose mutarotase-like enzyme
VNATPSGWIELRTDQMSAQIDPQGAQLSVLRDAGNRELLWHGDPAVWKGRAPILFPIVGALHGGQYRWCGQRHALGRHGFARDKRFTLVRQSAQEALFRLVDDETTRAVYPFAFELTVSYRMAGCRLTVEGRVCNIGTDPLPASLGFHPGFLWPLPGAAARDAYYLEFDAAEPAAIRRLDAQGLLTPARHATPVRGRRLPLDDALFTDDVIIFDAFTSRGLNFCNENGPQLRVEFPDATYLGLWTKPGAPFICIEPWRGIADPHGFDGELDEKPGVFLVPPGASEALTMHVEWLAG